MTSNNDQVVEALDAYFEYLENGGEEPSLDHLNPTDRAEANQLINSLNAGRGMDPTASRPSLAELMANNPATPRLGDIANIAQDIQHGLRSATDPGCIVAADLTAMAAGIGSDFVIACRGHRLRAIVTPSSGELDTLSPATVNSAAAIFGAFNDTAAILLVTTTTDRAAVVIERQDLNAAIEVPMGQMQPARVRRPASDPVSVCSSFLGELSPTFDPLDPAIVTAISGEAVLADVRSLAESSITAIVNQGGRAKIPEKKEAWGSLGDAEIDALAAAIGGLESGDVQAGDLSAWLDDNAPAEAA